MSGAARFSGPVLVVYNQFPKRSETFLFHEFIGWRGRGIDVRPVSLLSPRRESLPVEMEAAADLAIVLAPRVARELRCITSRRSLFRRPAVFRRLQRSVAVVRTRYDLAVRVLGWASGVVLAGVVAETRARLLHAAWANTPAEACLHASALMNVPYTVSIHAADYWRDTPATSLRLNRARCIVACNSDVYRDVVNENPELDGRIHLRYHGVAGERFMPVRREGGPPWKILAVGRLVPKKGFTVLLEACRILAMAGLPFTCQIVGDGKMSRKLRSFVRSSNLNDQVQLLGAMGHEGVARLMMESHVLVVPSVVTSDRDRDGAPNVIVEALLTAMPVIASRCGSIPEVLVDGVSGVLVDSGCARGLATALEETMSTYARAITMGQEGRRRMLERLRRETQGECLARLFAAESYGRPGATEGLG